MQNILLAVIRLYWRTVPASARSRLSVHGTSVTAYSKISAGDGGLLTFITAALPLRKIGGWLGVYDGPQNW